MCVYEVMVHIVSLSGPGGMRLSWIGLGWGDGVGDPYHDQWHREGGQGGGG